MKRHARYAKWLITVSVLAALLLVWSSTKQESQAFTIIEHQFGPVGIINGETLRGGVFNAGGTTTVIEIVIIDALTGTELGGNKGAVLVPGGFALADYGKTSGSRQEIVIAIRVLQGNPNVLLESMQVFNTSTGQTNLIEARKGAH